MVYNMYKEIHQKHIENYSRLIKQYEGMTNQDIFLTAQTTIMFDLLKARYLIDNLDIPNKNINAQFSFKSGEEAIQLFLDIVSFKKYNNEILEKATYIVEIYNLANKINKLIESDLYLPNNIKVPDYYELYEVAKECLEKIPRYQSLMTKTFRLKFIESCIASLSTNDLDKLIQSRIIKGTDIGKISLKNDTHYQENIKYLAEIMGMEIVFDKFKTRLKGVTFYNDDGTSRQELLKELKGLQNQHLSIESYMYKEPHKEPTPAYRIMWGDKCIGNLDKEIAANLSSNKNDIYDCFDYTIIGGRNANYGCEIEIYVHHTKEIEIEQSEMVKE